MLPHNMCSRDMIKDSPISINREDLQERGRLETTITNQGITINQENTIKENIENINREIQITNHKVTEEKISVRREPINSTITKDNRTTSNNSKDIRPKASNKPISSKAINKDIKLKDSNKLINSKLTNPKDTNNIKETMKNKINGRRLNMIPNMKLPSKLR